MNDSVTDRNRPLSAGRERAIVILIIGLGLLIGVRFFVGDPGPERMTIHFPTGHEISLPNCPFNEYTGLPCMICGLTRSTAHMVRGHIWRSWKTNPLGPFVVLGAIYAVLWSIRTLITGGPVSEPEPVDARRKSRITTIWVISILAVTWIINLARHWEWIRW